MTWYTPGALKSLGLESGPHLQQGIRGTFPWLPFLRSHKMVIKLKKKMLNSKNKIVYKGNLKKIIIRIFFLYVAKHLLYCQIFHESFASRLAKMFLSIATLKSILKLNSYDIAVLYLLKYIWGLLNVLLPRDCMSVPL